MVECSGLLEVALQMMVSQNVVKRGDESGMRALRGRLEEMFKKGRINGYSAALELFYERRYRRPNGESSFLIHDFSCISRETRGPATNWPSRMTPAILSRFMMRSILRTGFPSTIRRSATFPTSMVPLSRSIPSKRAAEEVAAMRASIGVIPSLTMRSSSVRCRRDG